SFHVNKLLGWHSKCCHYNHKGQLQSYRLYGTCTSRPIVIEHNYYLHVNASVDRSNSKYQPIVEHQIALRHHFLRELHDHLFLFEHKYSFHANKLLGWHSKCCHCSYKGQSRFDRHYQTCTSRPIAIEHNCCPPVNRLLC